MTRLAEVKAERDAEKRRADTLETAIYVVFAKPMDASIVVKEDKHRSYLIEAYGLARHDGGYVKVTFACAGQADTVRLRSFEEWLKGQGTIDPFMPAAARLRTLQHQLYDKRFQGVTVHA